MIRTPRTRLALALAGLLALAASAAVLRAGDDGRSTLQLTLHGDGGVDAVEITDLDELAVGERRDYSTDGGEPLAVTRDARGFVIEIDGRTLRVDDSDEPSALADSRPFAMRRIEIDGDGEARHFVISSAPDAERVIVHRGEDGEEGFAFSTGGGDPALVFAGPGLLARIERSEKFQALDDATRELVRELVRDATRPLAWVGEGDAAGDRIELRFERVAPAEEP